MHVFKEKKYSFLSLDGTTDTSLTSTEKDKNPNGPIKQDFLCKEQESSRKDRLNDLGRDTLIETGNTFSGNNLLETVQDGGILFITRLTYLHTRLDDTKLKKKKVC